MIESDDAAEELDSIGAIYPELIHSLDDRRHASLDLEVCPAAPIQITFRPTFTLDSIKTLTIDDDDAHLSSPESNQAQDDAESQHRSHQFSHLPSLHILVELPLGYPDAVPPIFKLSAVPNWIPSDTIDKLQRQAETLWEEYGHTQVVFAFIDFLQSKIESGFDLPDNTLTLSTSLEAPLIDYQHSARKAKFEAKTYDCGVCLYPKKGSVCHSMRGCGHVFCIECLQDFYNSAINEGSVETVQCLDPTCKKRKQRPKHVHPTELLDMAISREQVQRFVDLKLKKKLESDKTTIYCPRRWCQGPARSAKYQKYNTKDLESWPDDDSDDENDASSQKSTTMSTNTNLANKSNKDLVDRLAICSVCTYAFCHVCGKSWHGDFEDCLPKTAENMTEEEKASVDFIRLHTSPCPNCNAPAQKTMGCNHMICGQCMTHFCYLCSFWLPADDPYKHFNTKGMPCYMRLWELEEGDEGGADDGRGMAVFAGPRAAEQMAAEFAAM